MGSAYFIAELFGLSADRSVETSYFSDVALRLHVFERSSTVLVYVKLEQSSGELVGIKYIGFHNIVFYHHDAVRHFVVEITLLVLGQNLCFGSVCHTSSEHQRREESVKFIHILDLF